MAQAKRKKRFFEVEIPIINKETQLMAYEVSELNGRFVRYDLTRVLKGKSLLLQLKVKVTDGEIKLIPIETKLLPYYMKRMVRKGTDYVEDSFEADCKDAKIIIKPLLVTRRKVTRAVRKALRVKAKEDILEYAKEKTSEEIFEEVIKNKIQKYLSVRLKKIYPLSLCEIRILRIKKFNG